MTEIPEKPKKDKVRAAWIAFAGRILAHIVGAVVTIALAVLFLQKSERAVPVGQPAQVVRTAAPVRPGALTIAVLPLTNLSGDPQEEYVADGLTEALVTDLARVDTMRVVSRTSTMRYKGTRKPLPEIGLELGANLIVEGSIIKAGSRLRVTAQLIDAATDQHIWACSYDRSLGDLLAFHSEIAAVITQAVTQVLSSLERRPLPDDIQGDR